MQAPTSDGNASYSPLALYQYHPISVMQQTPHSMLFCYYSVQQMSSEQRELLWVWSEKVNIGRCNGEKEWRMEKLGVYNFKTPGTVTLWL